MKTKIYLSRIIISVCVVCLGFVQLQAQVSTSQNFVATQTIVNKVNVAYDVNQLKTVNTRAAIQYYDGMGRPIQSIAIAASPMGDDVIIPIEYDAFGRKTKDYYSFPKTGNNGKIVVNPVDELKTVYQGDGTTPANNTPWTDYQYDDFNPSMVNKVTAAGRTQGDHAETTEWKYFTGTLPKMICSKSGVVSSMGNYVANSVSLQTYTDANGMQSETYTNSQGQMIMKIAYYQNIAINSTTKGINGDGYNNGGTLDKAITSYVYDEKGLLRYIIPPMAYDKVVNGATPNDENVKKYCYYFEYDIKNRPTLKKFPAQEPIYIKYYKNRNLKLAEQDGLMREKGWWRFYSYDDLGRMEVTGIAIINNPDNFETTETAVIASVNYGLFENQRNYFSEYGSLRNNPDSAKMVFVKTYTDADFAADNRIIGMLTGNKTMVLDENRFLYSAYYYDKYGRLIQAITQNYLGDYDRVSMLYDFSGKMLKMKRENISKTGVVNLCLDYDFYFKTNTDYPYQARIIFKGQAYYLYELTYDKFGKIIKKRKGKVAGTTFLQDIDYVYNLKNQLEKINDPDNLGTDKFAMQFYYDKAEGNSQPLYNGMITAVKWNSEKLQAKGQNKNQYNYYYDGLYRLTRAEYSPNNTYSERFAYDVNGNVTALSRNGQFTTNTGKGLIDSLIYQYDGNLLQNIQECVKGRTTDGDFPNPVDPNGSTGGSTTTNGRGTSATQTAAYNYDVNGNMTTDLYKKITNITYNVLNLPTKVTFENNNRIEFTYTSTGSMVKKQTFTAGQLSKTTVYCGDLVYEDGKLAVIKQPEGIIKVSYTPTGTAVYTWQFYITDHLGNVRTVFQKGADLKAEVVQENHYYSYGNEMEGMAFNINAQKYKYQGKEKHNEFGLGWFSFDLRAYNPVIARWHNADPFNQFASPYIAMGNNPVNMIDPNGGESTGARHLYDDWDRTAKELRRMDRQEYENWQQSMQTGYGRDNWMIGNGSNNVVGIAGADGSLYASSNNYEFSIDRNGNISVRDNTAANQSMAALAGAGASGGERDAMNGSGAIANPFDLASNGSGMDYDPSLSTFGEILGSVGGEEPKSSRKYGRFDTWNEYCEWSQKSCGRADMDFTIEKVVVSIITGVSGYAYILESLNEKANRNSYFENASYTSKVERQMSKTTDIQHGFPKSVDGYASKYGRWSEKIGGDGNTYQWLKIRGEYKGKVGFFEYTKDKNGLINHRYLNLIKK